LSSFLWDNTEVYKKEINNEDINKLNEYNKKCNNMEEIFLKYKDEINFNIPKEFNEKQKPFKNDLIKVLYKGESFYIFNN
jgi:hypothetical protein